MKRPLAAIVVFGLIGLAPVRASARPSAFGGRAEATVRSAMLAFSEGYVNSHLDPATGMLRVTASSSDLDVRDTAVAALLFAERGRWGEMERAILGVLATQVTDPADPQVGNFPYLVGAPPFDLNWSAFIGSYLLVLMDRHGARLTPELAGAARDAIRRAAVHQSSVPRHPSYTNMAILSAFVLIRAGESLRDDAILRLGLSRWDAFVRQTDDHGIGEYNSPVYLMTDLYGLGFVADYVRDRRVRADATRVRRMFWWGITRRWHPQTSQLAGPYSRNLYLRMAYEPAQIQMTLYRESLGRIPLYNESYRSEVLDPERNGDTPLKAVVPTLVKRSWPDQWVADATDGVHQASSFRERTWAPAVDERDGFQQLTTHLGPRMAVGSVNRERSSASNPVAAHAVTATGEVGAFRAKLETTYGIENAHLVTVQQGTSLLLAVLGDWYYGSPYDRQLTIRLVWHGTATTPTEAPNGSIGHGQSFDVDWMGVPTAVRFAEASGQDFEVASFSTDRADDGASMSVRATFTLPETPPYAPNTRVAVPLVAAIHFGEQAPVTGTSIAPPTQQTTPDGKYLRIGWQSPAGLLEAQFPSGPRSWSVEQWIDGQLMVAQPTTPPA